MAAVQPVPSEEYKKWYHRAVVVGQRALNFKRYYEYKCCKLEIKPEGLTKVDLLAISIGMNIRVRNRLCDTVTLDAVTNTASRGSYECRLL